MRGAGWGWRAAAHSAGRRGKDGPASLSGSEGVSLHSTTSFTLFPLLGSGCVGRGQTAIGVRRRKWLGLAPGPPPGTLELLNVPLLFSSFPSLAASSQDRGPDCPLCLAVAPKAASALPLSPPPTPSPSRGAPLSALPSAGMPPWAPPPIPMLGPLFLTPPPRQHLGVCLCFWRHLLTHGSHLGPLLRAFCRGGPPPPPHPLLSDPQGG